MHSKLQALFFAILVLSIFAITTGTASDTASSCCYRALLISQSYEGTESSEHELTCAEFDTDAFSHVLTNMSGIPYTIYTCTDLKADEILETIRNTFAAVSDYDVSLLYFTGHGTILEDSRFSGGFIGSDNNAITYTQICELLKEIPGEKIIILDTCYAGSALQDIHSDPHMHVLAACNENELAEEITSFSSNHRYSIFTYALLYGCGYDEKKDIELPGLFADTDHDGRISMYEAFIYTRGLVNALSDSQHVVSYPDKDALILFDK